MTFRRSASLALLSLCLLLPAAAARGQDSPPPSPTGFKSAADVERYAAAAARFVQTHRDDPRSPTVALDLLAVGEWGHSAEVVDVARRYLLVNFPKTPQAYLAAQSFGGVGPYRDFVMRLMRDLLEKQTPAEVAQNFVVSLYPGVQVYGIGLLDDARVAVTTQVLGDWLLAEKRSQMNPAVAEFLTAVLKQLRPVTDALVRDAGAGKAGENAGWGEAARILRDPSLTAGDRVERLAAGISTVPDTALDLAILTLPEDANMSPQIARIRAGRAVDAGRWEEAATLARTILDQGAGDDLPAVRRWRALALSATAAESLLRAGEWHAPEEAIALLEQDKDDPASARLLAAIRNPALAAHAAAYDAAHDQLLNVGWAEVEGRATNARGDVLRFYFYDSLDPAAGRRMWLAFADAGGLISTFHLGPDGADAFARDGPDVHAERTSLYPSFDYTLKPITSAGPRWKGTLTVDDDRGGLVYMLGDWARDTRFADNDGAGGALPRAVVQLARAGLFPTRREAEGGGAELGWETTNGLAPAGSRMTLLLDAGGRLSGMRVAGDGWAVEASALHFGADSPPGPTPPAWAEVPGPTPARRRADSLSLSDLTPVLQPLFDAVSSAASPATRPAE